MKTLEILLILFSIYVLIRLFTTTHSKFFCLVPIIIAFDFVMVVPLGLELYLGIPETAYRNFTLAMEDSTTTAIFVGFLFCMQVAFLHEIRHLRKYIKKGSDNADARNSLKNIAFSKYRGIMIAFCYVVFGIILFKIAISPDPSYYFSINSVTTEYLYAISSYQKTMRTWIVFLGVAVIVLKLLDNRRNFLFFVSRIIFIITIVFVDQKRTLLMLVVGACFLIDYLNEHETGRLVAKYIVIFSGTAAYFFLYMYISNKISYNNDWYYLMNEYIFRSMHLRFAIYAWMHPADIHILDYPGQSILFSLFYWVPRALWTTKPWPYVQYYISGLLGYSSYNYSSIGWGMPTSYYPEFVSNFGLIGLAVGLLFTVWATRFFEQRNLICKLAGIGLITVLEVYYYDNALKILAFAVLLLFLKEFVSVDGRKITIRIKTRERRFK